MEQTEGRDDGYTFNPIAAPAPVEVIKAAHSAETSCAPSPGWMGSAAQRLLSMISTAATHRLPGYADAPWIWTRPDRRRGSPVGVTIGTHPEVPELDWVRPEELPEHWHHASLVVCTPAAARELPTDLPSRSGVFLLATDEYHNDVWESLTALDMPALVLFWPTCRPWLLEQLQDPAPDFVEHRSGQQCGGG